MMVAECLVSVVMPNYNGSRFVEQAVRSVLTQTYRNFEIIVVDDCSTDDSFEKLKALAKKDARIHVLQTAKNQGVAKTRNEGIALAKGDYIALLDNDDIWEPEKLEKQVRLAQNGADIVYCSYGFIDEAGKQIKKPFLVPAKTDYQAMLTASVISCSTALIKSDLLKAHPFKPEFYHEDYVLWMELLKLPSIALGNTEVLAYYRQVSGSRSNKKGKVAKERWNTFRKALGLNFFKSAWAFVGYTIKGIIKYYF